MSQSTLKLVKLLIINGHTDEGIEAQLKDRGITREDIRKARDLMRAVVLKKQVLRAC